MTPTENLINEHKVINDLLGIMSKIAEKIKSKGIFYTNDIEDIMEFSKNYIEKSHHGKEQIFYPVLASAEIPIEKEAISLMLYEHILTHNYLKDINNCVQNCKIGNAFSGEILAETLMNYVLLEERHMQKEVNIIYPIANDVLSNEQQNQILIQFDEIEQMIENKEFHNNYQKLLRNLKNKYPD